MLMMLQFHKASNDSKVTQQQLQENIGTLTACVREQWNVHQPKETRSDAFRHERTTAPEFELYRQIQP